MDWLARCAFGGGGLRGRSSRHDNPNGRCRRPGTGPPDLGRRRRRGGGGGCSVCHSLDGSENVGGFRAPTFQGISGQAGDRVPGLSAEDYLRESIVDPAAYLVEGYFADAMPKGLKILLSEEDIDNLVAFLLTQ